MRRLVIKETRTDPQDVTTLADGYELVEAVIEAIMDGADTIPGTVTLKDQNDEQHEVMVDFTTNSEREAVEKLIEFWPEEDWEEVRPVLGALFWMPKTWLKHDHDVEVI